MASISPAVFGTMPRGGGARSRSGGPAAPAYADAGMCETIWA